MSCEWQLQSKWCGKFNKYYNDMSEFSHQRVQWVAFVDTYTTPLPFCARGENTSPAKNAYKSKFIQREHILTSILRHFYFLSSVRTFVWRYGGLIGVPFFNVNFKRYKQLYVVWNRWKLSSNEACTRCTEQPLSNHADRLVVLE